MDLGVEIDNGQENGLDSIKNTTKLTDFKSIESITFKDFLFHFGNTMSLDISVDSTGLVKVLGDSFEFNTYHITAKESVDRRLEFREFLKKEAGVNSFTHLFIEDVIGSCNFKTARELYQLNVVPEDLVVDKLILSDSVRRIGNTEWKKWLRKASNYKAKLKGLNDKQVIADCLNALGLGKFIIDEVCKLTETIKSDKVSVIGWFDGKMHIKERSSKAKVNVEKEVNLGNGGVLAFDVIVPQDIYDAFGILIGCAYSDMCVTKESKRKGKLDDIRKGYTIKQFETFEDGCDFIVSKFGVSIPNCYQIRDVYKDIVVGLKKLFLEYDDDYYFMECASHQLGALAISKDLDISEDTTYILAYRAARIKELKNSL